MFAAAAIRLALVLRGGQYFDWDEHRYGFATLMLDRLRSGDIGGTLDILFRYPEHPGFKIIGLLPALFHLVSGSGSGYPITEMRYPSGEWLPAFLLSLASVCSIGLTYALARRAGASRDESFLAAFLMFSSTAMLAHARHFFPYDTAMAMFLLALWIGLINPDRPLRSVGVGALSGLAFVTYEGYWLLVLVIGSLRVVRRPYSVPRMCLRGVAFTAGLVSVPALLLAASALRGRSLLQATIRFSETVTHGEFSEGWLLAWKYFWDAEHGLFLILVLGVSVASLRSRRGLMWLGAAAIINTGLLIGSNVLHRFVVYDRLARQMLPFLCLAAAAGYASLGNGRWLSGRRAGWIYGVVATVFVINSWPLMTQRYPREIVGEVVRTYGSSNVQLDTTILHTIDATGPKFLPIESGRPESTSTPKRYVLLNASDIWIEGELGVKPPPRGRILLTARHPRQLRAMQYHGYTPEQRTFLRSVDFSIQLIDTEE